MPDLNDMAVFARVVEARSFSAAARRMGASKSRVSKSVARLERALGARLLNRSTRSLSLTEAGTAFFHHCSRMLEEAAKASAAVSAHHTAPQGLLRVSAPPAFGTLRLARALPGFLALYPEIRIELSLAERAADLVAHGFDVAITAESELPPGLAVRRLGAYPRLVCAAPEYLRAHGTPETPADLLAHNCLHAGRPWRLGGASLVVAGSLCADDDRALWQAARGGLGLALLPAYLVEEDLRQGRLASLLPAHPPAPETVHAVRMPGEHVAPKVRALIDYLCQRFASGRSAAVSPVPFALEASHARLSESGRRRDDWRRHASRTSAC